MDSVAESGRSPKDHAVLAAAREYAERGWSVIPVNEKKKAARAWKAYQSTRASQHEIQRWFEGSDFGVAIVMGDISGGLAVRDFDVDGAYAAWAAEHPEEAKELPTVATGRPGGYHVYCRIAPTVLDQIRGNRGRGALNLGDGELRADCGCYVVAPPSLHPSGVRYRWMVGPGPDIPLIDPRQAGLLECWAPGRCADTCYRVTDVVNSVPSVHSVAIDDRVSQAIAATLPAGVGQRRRRLFRFARELRAMPEFSACPAEDLLPYVQEWHRQALPFIGTKPFEETRWDFIEAWGDIRFPAGVNVADVCFRQAAKGPMPPIAHRYEGQKTRLLIALCYELQRANGEHPFLLSCRDAGRLLDEHHVDAARRLRGLVQDGVLTIVEKPRRGSGRAFRYRVSEIVSNAV